MHCGTASPDDCLASPPLWPLAGTMRAACMGLLAVLALAALRGARAQTTTYAPEVGDGWRRGRATFFGGDERFLSNFPDRGPPPEYGFGNIRYGSCGYYQQARACTRPGARGSFDRCHTLPPRWVPAAAAWSSM